MVTRESASSTETRAPAIAPISVPSMKPSSWTKPDRRPTRAPSSVPAAQNDRIVVVTSQICKPKKLSSAIDERMCVAHLPRRRP
jgi:hypothetical protein